MVLDGAGYTLRGSFNGNSTDIWVVGTGPDPTMAYYTIGVDLGGKDVDGVTVENLNVENFSIGMYIWTKNNTVAGNAFSGCIVGLLMSGSNSTITRNYVSDNIEGLFFGFNTPSGQFPAGHGGLPKRVFEKQHPNQRLPMQIIQPLGDAA